MFGLIWLLGSETLFKSANPKPELHVAALFVIGKHKEKITFHRSFLSSLVPFDQASGFQAENDKVYRQRTPSDNKNSELWSEELNIAFIAAIFTLIINTNHCLS